MNNNQKIKTDEVIRLAKLSKFIISETEIEKYLIQINKFLDYVSQLDKVDLGKIKPLKHVFEQVIIGREDDVGECIQMDELFINASKKQSNLFKVPQVLE